MGKTKAYIVPAVALMCREFFSIAVHDDAPSNF